MTDREILELAAKAAGMDYLVWSPGSAPIVPAKYRTRECLIADKICWNPLEYDGDALRLAVKLNMLVDIGTDKSACLIGNIDRIDKHNGEPYAATRRAIVRAAAEIGRSMK